MAHIAYLGTGLLGSGFAEAAAQRGDHVTAWNRSADKLKALAAFGIQAAATPADAVRGASRVHLILRDDAVVDEVIAAARPGLAADAIVIDHTTTQPKLTAARAARLAAEGVNYLHCPVFMAPAHARKAQGSMMAAGPQALFNRVQAELAAMTGTLNYLGERSDLAAVHKLFGNATIIGLSALMADVLTMAKAAQVPVTDVIELTKQFDLSAMAGMRAANMAKGQFDTPSFELAMARKDVRLMVETAGELPLAVLPGVAARMDQLIAQGLGAKDSSVIAKDAVQGG